MKPCIEMPLADLLNEYRPTDMLPSDYRRGLSAAEMWPWVFRTMQRERMGFAPIDWCLFRFSVCKRQSTPITLSRTRLEVLNGHHRIWALATGQKKIARVSFAD